jgi:hypothetical protein
MVKTSPTICWVFPFSCSDHSPALEVPNVCHMLLFVRVDFATELFLTFFTNHLAWRCQVCATCCYLYEFNLPPSFSKHFLPFTWSVGVKCVPLAAICTISIYHRAFPNIFYHSPGLEVPGMSHTAICTGWLCQEVSSVWHMLLSAQVDFATELFLTFFTNHLAWRCQVCATCCYLHHRASTNIFVRTSSWVFPWPCNSMRTPNSRIF